MLLAAQAARALVSSEAPEKAAAARVAVEDWARLKKVGASGGAGVTAASFFGGAGRS